MIYGTICEQSTKDWEQQQQRFNDVQLPLNESYVSANFLLGEWVSFFLFKSVRHFAYYINSREENCLIPQIIDFFPLKSHNANENNDSSYAFWNVYLILLGEWRSEKKEIMLWMLWTSNIGCFIYLIKISS